MSWFGQGLIAFIRVVFRALELVGPKNRRPRLREFREKVEGINRERDAIVSQMRGGATLSTIGSLDDRFGPFLKPEDRAGLQETAANTRARRVEIETLRDITVQAGEDKALAVSGYRAYVQSHPASPLGFSWLSAALKKAGDLEGSAAALREAIQIAGGSSIPGTSARLHLGAVLEEMGDADAAIAEFRSIIAEASSSTEVFVSMAYLSLGNALNARGDRSDARAAWKRAIKWDRTKILAKQARKQLAANR